MIRLFGIDIAGLVNSSIVAAGNVLTGTLHKRADGIRTDLLGGVNPSFTDSTFNGFIDRKTSTVLSGGQLTVREGETVSILGASVNPPAVPETGDEVTIEGNRYRITGVKDRDPAGALFVCEVER